MHSAKDLEPERKCNLFFLEGRWSMSKETEERVPRSSFLHLAKRTSHAKQSSHGDILCQLNLWKIAPSGISLSLFIFERGERKNVFTLKDYYYYYYYFSGRGNTFPAFYFSPLALAEKHNYLFDGSAL